MGHSGRWAGEGGEACRGDVADVRKDSNQDRAECGNLGASRNRESNMPNAADIRGDDCGRLEKIVLQGSSLL